MRKATFSGANVFLSRSLVAPELYDAVHDVLKLNGADIFLCSDPSRNSPNDYHVISSNGHEKFEDLKSKGCNLLGPQCILSCAKEHRVLPKQGYTCCLAMDGVKVLASGFERDKKAIGIDSRMLKDVYAHIIYKLQDQSNGAIKKLRVLKRFMVNESFYGCTKVERRFELKAVIGQLVTAMGGVLQTKASLDVNFVIVKDVLAAKYKYALNVLKKPIVNLSWLYQCWTEHRVVPQEPFKILPFTGLTICVTKIPPDERKEIEKLIIENGGRYSADLTKKCTHLVSDAPIGDKYVVAQRWGHIHIVTRKWVDQSIAKRGCLDEGSYPVDKNPKSCAMKGWQKEQCYQELCNMSSQPVSGPAVEDLDATLSQNISSSFTEARVINNEDINAPIEQMKDETTYDCRVADDSETEDNDLYLSNCRIFLIGFEEMEHAKLVNMIRKGGGTRHMQFSEKLTHIILGTPSEDDKREVRRLAAWGVIHVVKSSWLEECDRTKRELSVSPRHIASELLVSKEPSFSVSGVKNRKCSTSVPCVPKGPASDGKLSTPESREVTENFGTRLTHNSNAEVATKFDSIQLHAVNSESKNISTVKTKSFTGDFHASRSSNVFKRKSFCFSSSFPMEQRCEVVRWIEEGGGVLVDDQRKFNADFIVERHGMHQFVVDISRSTNVSTHWIRSSLDEGCMQDVGSHILYSPLHCHTPLPGFECIKFCVSQHEEKDKILLKNLCVTLGAKLSFRLTKKTTHLLCKFTNGPKYEAACKWGIPSVTPDWITECITQNKMVSTDPFRPRPVTAEDREAGLCTVSQYPTQAANMVSGYAPSQLLTQSQLPMDNAKVNTDNSSAYGKRPRLRESNNDSDASKKNKIPEGVNGGSEVVPDVADAIEDLLAQSNIIQDMKLPGTSCGGQSIFSSDHSSILCQNHASPRSTYGISRHWLNRTEKHDHGPNPAGPERKVGGFDSFSETQTESQVVGYEEDLTGRQKIIDRVRSQALTLTPDK